MKHTGTPRGAFGRAEADICAWEYGRSYIYHGGNKGFRQGWMMRGGSSLHCSRWNPNAIHKGCLHYPACIYHYIHAIARSCSVYGHRCARLKIECTQMCGAAVPFTVCGVVSTWQLCRLGSKNFNLPQNCKVERKIYKGAKRTAVLRVLKGKTASHVSRIREI